MQRRRKGHDREAARGRRTIDELRAQEEPEVWVGVEEEPGDDILDGPVGGEVGVPVHRHVCFDPDEGAHDDVDAELFAEPTKVIDGAGAQREEAATNTIQARPAPVSRVSRPGTGRHPAAGTCNVSARNRSGSRDGALRGRRRCSSPRAPLDDARPVLLGTVYTHPVTGVRVELSAGLLGAEGSVLMVMAMLFWFVLGGVQLWASRRGRGGEGSTGQVCSASAEVGRKAQA